MNDIQVIIDKAADMVARSQDTESVDSGECVEILDALVALRPVDVPRAQPTRLTVTLDVDPDFLRRLRNCKPWTDNWCDTIEASLRLGGRLEVDGVQQDNLADMRASGQIAHDLAERLYDMLPDDYGDGP